MENKEFIVEAVKRLLPDTFWWGESYHDGKSVKNIEIVKEVLQVVLENICRDMFVPADRKGNGSFEHIAKTKQEAFKEILEYFEYEIKGVMDNENNQ